MAKVISPSLTEQYICSSLVMDEEEIEGNYPYFDLALT